MAAKDTTSKNTSTTQTTPGAAAAHRARRGCRSPGAAVTAPPAAAATTALTQPPEAESFDYGDDAGQGFENQDMSDRKLPIIELLQSNSPQVVESKGKIWAGVPQHGDRRGLRRGLLRAGDHRPLLDRVDPA